jgi:oligopeptide transport system ATP-binding protein
VSSATEAVPPVAEDQHEVALDVVDLDVDIRLPGNRVRAVEGVSLRARKGRTLALLGESGCGKSMTAKAIAGLLDPAAVVAGGRVVLDGTDLASLAGKARRRLAGRSLGIVFQDALTVLNPVYSVGWQIAEVFRIHDGASRRLAKQQAIELMERVGIPEAAQRYHSYPHQFSGGMRQRIVIAIAVALKPSVLIADEATTALDVIVQAQIMDLLRELRKDYQMAVLLITHDLGLAAKEADEVAVMYAGRVVEQGPVAQVLRDPRHPYTRALLRSALPPRAASGEPFPTIPGSPPDLAAIPSGCTFVDRCQLAQLRCTDQRPVLRMVDVDHSCACHFATRGGRDDD